jgi:hypothetical protein
MQQIEPYEPSNRHLMSLGFENATMPLTRDGPLVAMDCMGMLEWGLRFF